ncbi:uncharacterized protein LOC129910804 [Episyrphus balteatus]|uniref:uncharacterized protein LOC129910804 n=1 Tax=Episyrphus balteatus TaxID=286459 RepID=UPI002485E604|nr:uncharacterized protein LOC129910804 [Episyrphus balteatus]
MNLKLIALLQFYNVNATTSPSIMLIKQKADEVLMKQQILVGASVCHTYYSEVLKNLLETYEKDIKQCQDNENDQLEALLNEEQQSRDDTTESLNEVCAILDSCNSESENLNFFDCVSNSGDKNTRAIWNASKDSSEIAAHIRNQIQVIKFQAEQCSSNAERAYIVGTAKATDDMIACYANGGIIPSTPSTI